MSDSVAGGLGSEVWQFNASAAVTDGHYSFSNDASWLLQRGFCGRRYLHLAWPQTIYSRRYLGSFLAIGAFGASDESTEVRVRPTVNLVAGGGVSEVQPGHTAAFVHQGGDVLLLVGQGDGDLSGSLVDASRRVAVLSGANCLQLPQQLPAFNGACDHVEEQLPPVESWGRAVVVPALQQRFGIGSYVRILSLSANNLLSFDPPSTHEPVRLDARQVLDLPVERSFLVRGEGRFLVAQFMASQGRGGSRSGDPALVYQPPVELWRRRFRFAMPESYTRRYLDAVAPRGAIVLLDDAPLRGTSQPAGPYEVWHAEVSPGVHTVRSTDDAPLALTWSAVDQFVSFLTTGGYDVRCLDP
jgi:hypothetical protein